MDHFLSNAFNTSQLVSINRCQVYLQVLLLSDIVSADGCHLIPQVLSRHRLANRKSSLVWPEQQSPSKGEWEIWSTALQTLAPGNRLVVPIDMSLINTHQRYFWYMDSIGSLLNVSESQEWIAYHGPSLGQGEPEAASRHSAMHSLNLAPLLMPLFIQ